MNHSMLMSSDDAMSHYDSQQQQLNNGSYALRLDTYSDGNGLAYTTASGNDGRASIMSSTRALYKEMSAMGDGNGNIIAGTERMMGIYYEGANGRRNYIDGPLANKTKIGTWANSLAEGLKQIYDNANSSSTNPNYFENSMVALRINGNVSFYMQPTFQNTESKSYNVFGALQKMGYEVLFQVHSHRIVGASIDDAEVSQFGRVPIVTWLSKKDSTYWFSVIAESKNNKNGDELHPRFYFFRFLNLSNKPFRKPRVPIVTWHENQFIIMAPLQVLFHLQ